ncbi:hypothetical protein WKI68_37550 [Streptomyces sp. MS1.HAVA.3]|uniref:Uncharacterized protein n=1 Tax=Streptomyces caledonius TaxID=3134107 RepID=A0ABU8UE48_9ACTN
MTSRAVVAEQQAALTRLLLPYVDAPFTGKVFVRGVLPMAPRAGKVRLVVGGRKAHTPDRLRVYEVRIRDPYEMLGVLRELCTGTHIYSGDSVSTLMGMMLVRAEEPEPGPPGPDGNTLALLHGLTQPRPGSRRAPETRLRGFLYRGVDRLRLYCDSPNASDASGVVGIDVRPSQPFGELISALPTLDSHESDDPHCRALVDLT